MLAEQKYGKGRHVVGGKIPWILKNDKIGQLSTKLLIYLLGPFGSMLIEGFCSIHGYSSTSRIEIEGETGTLVGWQGRQVAAKWWLFCLLCI